MSTHPPSHLPHQTPMIRLMRASALTPLLFLFLLGCTEQIPVANTPATISDVDSVALSDTSSILVGYNLADEEGDDQSIIVEICEGTEDAPTACGLAFEGEGSDEAAFVPTMENGEAVRRVFAWEVACGRVVMGDVVVSDVGTTYVARLRIREVMPEAWSYSPTFVLSDLGLDSVPECMR